MMRKNSARYQTLIMVILPGILFMQCIGGKRSAYLIPDNVAEPKRSELISQCKKGKELYKVNCSECHGIFTTGKDKVPNFTTTQIDNYSAKFLRHDPKNHAVTRQMSPEQLNEILMFLRYRKIKD